MISARLGHPLFHLPVGFGNIELPISKKIVRNAYLLIGYAQKSNVRSMNRLHNAFFVNLKSGLLWF